MDILGLIKDKLTDAIIAKVSNFLGEHPDKIGPALNSAVPVVLGGIIQNASNEEEAGKVMDVLKDGGHTGEILDDLPNLLGNFDKTQLLITIGSNIFNHFTGNKGNGIIEKLSTIYDIRKTSASSLVGLATPLVLGALGKVVSKEGLGVSGLMKLLAEQKEGVFGALPPAIANQLDFKRTPVVAAINEDKPKEEDKTVTNRTRFSAWIPWALIFLVFLAVLAYFWKYRKKNITEPTLNSVGVLPKQDTTLVKDTMSVAFPTESVNNTLENNNTEKENPIKVTEEIKVTETPKNNDFDNNLSAGSISEKLKNSNVWVGLGTNFKKNSAEISSKRDLDEVVKFLKNNRKAKIIIAGGSESKGNRLAEDRAYAIREILLERGVSENQLSVQSSPVKEVNATVAIKIK